MSIDHIYNETPQKRGVGVSGRSIGGFKAPVRGFVGGWIKTSILRNPQNLPSIDTADLKRSVDLLSLVERDTPLKKVARTRGGEYSGPCTWCGGHDRFRVQPEQGLWFCRGGCSDDRWQDAIAYVQKRDGSTFAEACQTLGAPDRSLNRPVNNKPKPAVPEVPEPTPGWRKQAAEVVETCRAALWTDPHAKARTWLHARGLTDETIAIWDLGHNPSRQTIAGLDVPQGIVIPWYVDGELWQAKVRRPPGLNPKYLSVPGGHPLLYGMVDTLEGYPAAVLTEGEFDTLLLWQECRDLVSVVTLGSCSKGLTVQVARYLTKVPHLLVAYDVDRHGEEGASHLVKLSPRIQRIRPLVTGDGTDITDFHKQGGSLRNWMTFHLRRLEV